MASEYRSSRPYSKLRGCQQAFGQTVLYVGDEEVAHNGSRQITEREFLNEKFQISFGKDKQSFDTLVSELNKAADAHGISHDEIEVMVIASSTWWKFSEKLWSRSLDEFAALEDPKVTLASRRDRKRSFNFPSRQLRIEACCSLSKTIEKRPLRPYRKGTWLAQSIHLIGTGQDFDGFEPKPLDAAARSKLGIDEYQKTQRFMHVEADPTDPAMTDEDFDLYVDEETLRDLEDNPRSPGTSLITRILGMDMARAIIYRASEAINDGPKSLADIQGSVFDRILDAKCRDDKGAVSQDAKEKLFANVKRSPEIFVALVEDKLGEEGFGRDLRELASGGG